MRFNGFWVSTSGASEQVGCLVEPPPERQQHTQIVQSTVMP
jgi:hypothetical protein